MKKPAVSHNASNQLYGVFHDARKGRTSAQYTDEERETRKKKPAGTVPPKDVSTHRDVGHLHGHKAEALGLEALDDLADDAALYAIRLDHNECSLILITHFGAWY